MKLLKIKMTLGIFFIALFFCFKASLCFSCEFPFGSFIGKSHLTVAYNNCGCEELDDEYNYIEISGLDAPIFTGLKWQCVEYARRFLIENKGITFDSIDYAFQIWDLKHFNDVFTNKITPVIHHENGRSITLPETGDLLIYSDQLVYTGHVAVILEVDSDYVTVGEQNYSDGLWDEIDYSRKLQLLQDENGNFSIVDEAVIGWIRVKQE